MTTDKIEEILQGTYLEQNEPDPDRTEESIDINGVNDYIFMNNAYYGSGGFKDGNYLVPHQREMYYPKRKQLSFYKNYVKSIINSVVDPIFIDLLTRYITNKNEERVELTEFDVFLNDSDNSGEHLQSVIKDALLKCALHSISFVAVDNFSEEQQPATAQEAIDYRILPYTIIYCITSVKDYGIDDFGNLENITFDTGRKIQITKSVKGKDETKEYNILIYYDSNVTIEFYIDDEKTKVMLKEAYHGLGIMPVVIFQSVKRKKKRNIFTDPQFYQLARINHAIYNVDSEVRELQRAQGFSILYVQTDDPSGAFTVGPNNVIYVPMEATIPPGFASPDSQIAQNLASHAEALREDLYRIAEKNGVTGVQKAMSGIAKDWDFRAEEKTLRTYSRIAMEAEIKVVSLFLLYLGKEEYGYFVEYPKDFAPGNIDGEIDTADRLLTIGYPPKATALIKKKALRAYAADQNRVEVEEAEAEINKQTLNEFLTNSTEDE